jgi:hypothetical protein
MYICIITPVGSSPLFFFILTNSMFTLI